MKISAGSLSGTSVSKAERTFCRRVIAATVLTAAVFVAPVIATMSHLSLHEVRLPRIDSRVIENLQRWADDETDSWSEEV